MTQLSFKAH